MQPLKCGSIVLLSLCLLTSCETSRLDSTVRVSKGVKAGAPVVSTCAGLRQGLLTAASFPTVVVVEGHIQCDSAIWGPKISVEVSITLGGATSARNPRALIDWGDLEGVILLGAGAVVRLENLVLVQNSWRKESVGASAFESTNNNSQIIFDLRAVSFVVRSRETSCIDSLEDRIRSEGQDLQGRLCQFVFRGEVFSGFFLDLALDSPRGKVGDEYFLRASDTLVVCRMGDRRRFGDGALRSADVTEGCAQPSRAREPVVKRASVSFVASACVAAVSAIMLSVGTALVTFRRWAGRMVWGMCGRACSRYKKDNRFPSVEEAMAPCHCIEVPYLNDPTMHAHSLDGLGIADIQIGSPLGRGGFGKVYKGFFHDVVLAVKVIEHDGNLLRGKGEPLEALLSMHVDHPNVVKTYLKETRGRNSVHASVSTNPNYCSYQSSQPVTGREVRVTTLDSDVSDDLEDLDDFSYIEKNLRRSGQMDDPNDYRTWIVMEFCDKGSLATAIKSLEFFYERDKLKPKFVAMLLTALDIASAMAYLHSQKVIHGDLKAHNVLLKSTSADERGFYCKVGDFGLSRMVLNNTHIETFTCGTVRYMPPELLKDGLLTSAVDVYSFGMLMWELVTGMKPYPGKHHSDIIVSVVEGRRPPIPPHCPWQFASLIQECWHQNHTKRPTFRKVLEHLRSMASMDKSLMAYNMMGVPIKEERTSMDSQLSGKNGSADMPKTPVVKAQAVVTQRFAATGFQGQSPALAHCLPGVSANSHTASQAPPLSNPLWTGLPRRTDVIGNPLWGGQVGEPRKASQLSASHTQWSLGCPPRQTDLGLDFALSRPPSEEYGVQVVAMKKLPLKVPRHISTECPDPQLTSRSDSASEITGTSIQQCGSSNTVKMPSTRISLDRSPPGEVSLSEIELLNRRASTERSSGDFVARAMPWRSVTPNYQRNLSLSNFWHHTRLGSSRPVGMKMCTSVELEPAPPAVFDTAANTNQSGSLWLTTSQDSLPSDLSQPSTPKLVENEKKPSRPISVPLLPISKMQMSEALVKSPGKRPESWDVKLAEGTEVINYRVGKLPAFSSHGTSSSWSFRSAESFETPRTSPACSWANGRNSTAKKGPVLSSTGRQDPRAVSTDPGMQRHQETMLSGLGSQSNISASIGSSSVGNNMRAMWETSDIVGPLSSGRMSFLSEPGSRTEVIKEWESG